MTCAPTRAGNYSVSVSIKDSNGMMVYSPAFSLVVSPSLGAVVVSVSRTTLDIGQPLTISANEAGSTGIYTLTWSGLPSGCLNGGFAAIQCWPTTAGTSSVSVTVMDSNGASVTLSSPVSVTVSADPTLGIPGGSPATLDLGQTTVLSVAATNGSGAATLTWWGLPTGCTSTRSLTCTPTTTGTFEVTVSELDSNGMEVTSGPMTLLVSNALGLPGLSVSSSNVDVGQPVTLSVNVTGGSSPWTYTWSGLPKGCAGNAATLTCIPTSAGSWTALVTITDGKGVSRTSAGANLTVAPRLTAGSIALSPSILDVGQSTNLTAGVSGGSGGLSFTWYGLPAGCSGVDVAAISCRPSAAGTSRITVWVADRNGDGVTVGPLALIVSPGLGTPSVSVSTATFELGGSVTFTASVSVGKPLTPTVGAGSPRGVPRSMLLP